MSRATGPSQGTVQPKGSRDFRRDDALFKDKNKGLVSILSIDSINTELL